MSADPRTTAEIADDLDEIAADLGLKSYIRRAARAASARLRAMDAALATAVRVAEEARREWDAAPEGMKAGKLLMAMTDPALNYRADITAMHAARTARGES